MIAEELVAVTMPDGTREGYALMRDTTQEKRAEEALRLHPQRLIETQEAEGPGSARELHDEIGQPLTGVIMLTYRIVQEALTNCARHAAVRKVSADPRVIAELPVEREERPR
ncbi:MAG TPA: hypothetical protein VHW00_24945 [Thermoanaerobaculia bacterium]|nr:hypothetical protein [Thermoanaerobaculia bacterium]